MKTKPSYVAAAFNARPFGMPIAPNWFGLAAFGMLGALLNPGLWLIGLGLEGLYLWTLSRNARFQAVVDAIRLSEGGVDSRYQSLAANLDKASVKAQADIEQQATEIMSLLTRVDANDLQIADVRQMAWLHLKLLAARAALSQVIDTADRERANLEQQEKKVGSRLANVEDTSELHHSLTRQLEVIQSRRSAHADALSRRELVDAELDRLRQQVSLVREQALLATDEQSVAQSLDALSASLNEANRWLKDQRELLTGFGNLNDEPPPELLRQHIRKPQEKHRGEME